MNEPRRFRIVGIGSAFLIVVLFVGLLVYIGDGAFRSRVDALLGGERQALEVATPVDTEPVSATTPPRQAEAGEQSAVPDNVVESGPIMPGLDVVRVEPSGDAVFAGRGEPGWTVEMRANGAPIGHDSANASGEWAIVTDGPLDSGSSDITLHAISPDGAMTVNAPDRVAVDIGESRKSQPLVVVTSPDAPADIVQLPETDRPPADSGSTAPRVDRTKTDGTEKDASTARPTADTTAGEPEGILAQGAPGGGMVVASSDPKATNAGDAQASPPGATVSSDGETTEAATLGKSVRNEIVQDAATRSATAGEASTSVSMEQATPGVSIETVENTESDQIFVTGRAEPGETVRAYSDNAVLGDAVADVAGKWRVASRRPDAIESGAAIAIRADALDPATGRPTTRAEVRFERLEPGETLIALMPVPTARANAPDAEFDRLVVQKGDSLWRLSRRIYGQGIRFTNIYRANQNQIRNPDLIYPGQVFAVPKGLIAEEG